MRFKKNMLSIIEKIVSVLVPHNKNFMALFTLQRIGKLTDHCIMIIHKRKSLNLRTVLLSVNLCLCQKTKISKNRTK